MNSATDNPRTERRVAEAEYRSASPSPENAPRPNSRPWFWLGLATLLLAADRALKSAALLRGAADEPGVFAFSLFRNEGIAFSIPFPAAVFWPAAVAIVAVLLVLFAKAWRADRAKAGIIALILLGAASNLYDRAAYGAIIDYLLFFGRSAVNIADGMIVAGLVALYVRQGRVTKKKNG